MLDAVLVFWNDNFLLSWIAFVILFMAIIEFAKRLFRVTPKHEPVLPDIMANTMYTDSTAEDEHLREFYILTEPERNHISAQADVVSGVPRHDGPSLTIGFVRDDEWVTVSHDTFEMSIGSGENCQIRLPNKRGILAEHALIMRQDDTFQLIAKGKLTIDNQKFKEPVNLSQNAVIRIGNQEIELYYSGGHNQIQA